MDFQSQLFYLFILAIPVACIAWTVTHEEIFVEIREYCKKNSVERKSLLGRKFFYLFTCEYCFSFYVVILILILTKFQMLYTDWKGYLVAGFSLVWIANIYMSIFFFIRIDIKKKGTEAKIEQKNLEEKG
ncbi:MAG: hypothetical protein ABI772_06440 [Bacteroidota bacterium]